MAKKLVSIVIVTRNRREVVSDCLKTVFKMEEPPFEVILVDNGSSDDTSEAIKKSFPKVKVISSPKNLGLNGGKNLGQKQAKGDYILFLDSDTLVDKDLLKELVLLADSEEKIGIVCPKMYFFDQKNVIWYAGSFVNMFTSRTLNIGCNEEDKGQYDQIRETQFAPTAYLAKRSVVNKLQGHDETFFMTYGDTDYGFRAQEAGFKVMFCPKAKLWHRLDKEENTKTLRALGFNLPMRAYYFARNRIIFMKKHAKSLNFIIFMIIFFPLFTFYITYKILIFGGGMEYLKPYWLGSLHGLAYGLGLKSLKNEYR